MVISRFATYAWAVILVANASTFAQSGGNAVASVPIVLRLYTSEDRLQQGQSSYLLAEIENDSENPITVSSQPLAHIESGAQPGTPKAVSATQPTLHPDNLAEDQPNSIVLRIGVSYGAAPRDEPGVKFQGVVTELHVARHARLYLPIVIDLGSLPPGKIKLTSILFIKGLGTFQSDLRETEVVTDPDDK